MCFKKAEVLTATLTQTQVQCLFQDKLTLRHSVVQTKLFSFSKNMHVTPTYIQLLVL